MGNETLYLEQKIAFVLMTKIFVIIFSGCTLLIPVIIILTD